MSESNPTRRNFMTAVGGSLLAAGAVNALGAGPVAPPDKQPPDLKLPEGQKKKAGWAIVGLGQLSLEEILPAFSQCEQSQVVALVSGHPDKAKKLAQHYGVKESGIYNYDNYDSIKDNKDVDVIYIVLPNSMHAEYTIRGLRAGKHVLCEKPMAVTSNECRQMNQVSKETGKKLMIAYRLRYEPFNQTAIEMATKRTLGKVISFEASNMQNTKAPNIRLTKSLGGGPLGDVGIYCLNASRYLLNEEPIEATGIAHKPADDDRFSEVDATIAFQLKFPSGAIAHCACSFASAESRSFRLHCEKGWINLENAFAYKGQRLTVNDGKSIAEFPLSPVDHFAAEMDHFSKCVLEGADVRTPGEEGLRDMIAIEAIFEAIRTGKSMPIRMDV